MKTELTSRLAALFTQRIKLRYLRALSGERYSLACATVATSAAECKTTQSFWCGNKRQLQSE